MSFKTFINPIIPGDHPDPTLTKIGKYFYTSGSSFNPTPKIYRSTDLVHWQVIAQPVAASWSQYGDSPGGGIWGGHMVYHKDSYWHFFGRPGIMYFVKADDPAGSWSAPTRMNTPAGVPGLGQDNSIFIDDNDRWYLLSKNGRENNWIIELGEDGQPSGDILDLTWLNPSSEGNPYGWAEGPVMWKRNGYYYYSFAQHLAGAQYVMRSDTLTDDKSAWTIVGDNIFTGPLGTFRTPNHISPVVMLDDGTSWTIAQSYHSSSNWYAQGRQGLLCQVTYNDQGFPVIQYPPSDAAQAPILPSSGIPWTVPKSDMFTPLDNFRRSTIGSRIVLSHGVNSPSLKPEWSLLGYTPDQNYSLTDRPGWLRLAPYRGNNTVIQNDGEHSYALITRVEFEPETTSDEAGLWIINGPETHQVKVYSTVNGQGKSVLAFRFDRTPFEVENTIGSAVWLKLVRNEHTMSGFYSADGFDWNQIGREINATALDVEQSQFNNFTGNQQGLYVAGSKPAFFDLYVYRDAYTDIPAQNPANAFGVTASSSYLRGIENDDWALYAGVEFGGQDYPVYPVALELEAASATAGGVVEVWLDSIATGRKIAECIVENTGSTSTYEIFGAEVDSVTGSHDVYLRFLGTGTQELFRIRRFRFIGQYNSPTSVRNASGTNASHSFSLAQNYPNPFNPTTYIGYSVPKAGQLSLKVYNLLGEQVTTLFEGVRPAGTYETKFDATGLAGGIYVYKLVASGFSESRKLLVLK